MHKRELNELEIRRKQGVFTSDTHFYHSNIIGFCKRPFKNVEDMNETLIENRNRAIRQDDIVFHL